jgi:hypothetical protein
MQPRILAGSPTPSLVGRTHGRSQDHDDDLRSPQNHDGPRVQGPYEPQAALSDDERQHRIADGIRRIDGCADPVLRCHMAMQTITNAMIGRGMHVQHVEDVVDAAYSVRTSSTDPHVEPSHVRTLIIDRESLTKPTSSASYGVQSKMQAWAQRPVYASAHAADLVGDPSSIEQGLLSWDHDRIKEASVALLMRASGVGIISDADGALTPEQMVGVCAGYDRSKPPIVLTDRDVEHVGGTARQVLDYARRVDQRDKPKGWFATMVSIPASRSIASDATDLLYADAVMPYAPVMERSEPEELGYRVDVRKLSAYVGLDAKDIPGYLNRISMDMSPTYDTPQASGITARSMAERIAEDVRSRKKAQDIDGALGDGL